MIKRKSVAAAQNRRIRIDIEFPAPTKRSDGVARPSSVTDSDGVDDYLADMIAQLEGLARASNKEMLAYLLSMASVQAAKPEERCDRSSALH